MPSTTVYPDKSEVPSTRKEAKETGSNFYYTGKPCKYGHYSLRYTLGNCVECHKLASKSRPRDKEKDKKSTYTWREKNREKWDSYMKQYKKENAEGIKKQRKKYKEQNKEKIAEYNKWHRENRYWLHVKKYQKRRMKLQQAYFPYDEELMDLVCEEAVSLRDELKEITGEDFHIDHIIPINSPYVCGLHNEYNLQVIPATANIEKGNFYWSNMPDTSLAEW